ncbi:toll/interleukin-1 receptor domain-containing protein [Nocardia sp. FBN12]|uniref:toll/interleukin-1 receptor domain-containing protein n=1 Tax=Nocardia sp. FBN12 TaxID=3419766 RepID=UPI003CFEDAB2
MGAQTFDYDAFLSYSHADRAIAAGIQKGLHRIGRRIGRLAALRVFRDATDLTASPDLWGMVTDAMDRSRYLIVVLSTRSVTSKWVDREVAYWLATRGPRNLMLVVTGGRLGWDEHGGRIDPACAEVALPALTVRGALPTEPFGVDVGGDAPWDPAAPLFREKVTDLAAPIHGKPKYELASEDARELRRFRRLRRGAVAALVVLTILALAAAGVAVLQRRDAVQQRNEAIHQRNQAIGLRLGSDADAMFAGARPRDDLRAINQALASRQLSPSRDPAAEIRALNDLSATEKIIRTGLPWAMPAEITAEALRQETERSRPVMALAVHPDGRRIITAGAELRTWDGDTGRPVATAPLVAGSMTVAYDPDGRRVLVSGADLRFLDAETGAPVGEPFPGVTEPLGVTAISRDGRWVAGAGHDGSIRVWDTGSRTSPMVLTGHEGEVHALAFGPDGRLVSGGADATVRRWDVRAGDTVGEPLRRHTAPVRSVAYSPDGLRIASGGGPDLNAPIVLWDANTGLPVGDPMTAHEGYVAAVDFAPDSQRFLTAGNDSIRVWDAATGAPAGQPLIGHTGYLTDAAFSPDPARPRIASSAADGTLRVWNADAGNSPGHRWLPPAAATPAGHVLSEPIGNRTVQVLADPASGELEPWIVDLESGSRTGPLRLAQDRAITAYAFSPDGHRAAFGRQDGSVRIWDTASGHPVGESHTGFGSAVTDLVFSEDGRRIAAGGEDRTVVVREVDTGRMLGPPRSGPAAAITTLALDRDGRHLAAADDTHALWLWDVDAGTTVAGPIAGHAYDVTRLIFTGEQRLLSVSVDGVRGWDPATGRGIHHTNLSGVVNAFAVSPDERSFVTATGLTLQRWDTVSGTVIGAPMAKPGGKTLMFDALAFTPDGRYIVAGGLDGTVHLWDAVTGDPVGEPMPGPDGMILRFQIGPDSREIRADWASRDGTDSGIWVWPGPAAWTGTLCSKLGENMTEAEWSDWVSPDIGYIRLCRDLPGPGG